MTVSTTNSAVSYTGDGSTTAFAVTFEFIDSSEVKVYTRVIASGIETLKSLTTHYTLAGGSGLTGTVTFLTPPPSTEQVHIIRDTTRTQPNDFTPSQRFPSASVERALDRAVMSGQDILGTVSDRAITIPVTDPAAGSDLPNAVDRASKVLGFDSAGVPTMIENLVSGESVTSTGSTTARTLAERFSEIKNVKDFGAKGDGVTNDTAAVEAAMAAVPSTGGRVFFPNGTYLVKDVEIPAVSEIELYGDSGRSWTETGGAQLKALDGTVSFLLANTNYAQSSGTAGPPLVIRNLRFNGDDLATDCLILTNFQSEVSDCHIFGATRDGLQLSCSMANGATISNNNVNSRVLGCKIQDNGRYGMNLRSDLFQDKVTDVNAENNIIHNNGDDGVNCDSSGGLTFFGNRVFSNDGWDMDILKAGPGVIILSNHFGAQNTETIVEWGVSVSRQAAVAIRSIGTTRTALLANNRIAGVVYVLEGSSATDARLMSAGNVYQNTEPGDAYLYLQSTTKIVVYSTGDSFETAEPFRSNLTSGNNAQFFVSNSTSRSKGKTLPLDGEHNPVGSSVPVKSRSEVVAFADADATPSVAGGYLFKTANTGATTITALDDGHEGQVIRVIFNDANTTVDFTGTNLKGNVGVDWSPATNDHMTCVHNAATGLWHCDISDNTA